MHSTSSNDVLIVGTYSGLNKGDRLMQQITAMAVRSNGGNPIIASPFPNIDSKIYTDTKITKSRRRNLPLSLLQCFILILLPKKYRSWYAERNDELRMFEKAILVVDTSGDMLTEDYGSHVALSHLFPLLYCKLLDKKLLVFAQSIGPFKWLGRIFDSVLRHAIAVNVRDEITYNYLAERHIDGITNVADLGFLLQPTEFDTSGIIPPSKDATTKLIGICPSALFFDKFARSNTDVSLENFCRLLDTQAQALGLSYVVVPHVMTPSGSFDDNAFATQLVERLTAECVIVDSSLEPAEMKFLVSKLDGMITFRMHGAIAALDTYTPTIAISYSHKTDGLFAKLAMDEWVIQNDERLLENLEKKLPALIANEDSVRLKLNSEIPQLRAQAKTNLAILQKAMSQ